MPIDAKDALSHHEHAKGDAGVVTNGDLSG
jgi:hypothetical protein